MVGFMPAPLDHSLERYFYITIPRRRVDRAGLRRRRNCAALAVNLEAALE